MSKRKFTLRRLFRAVAKKLPVNLRLLLGIKLRRVKKKGATEKEIKVLPICSPESMLHDGSGEYVGQRKILSGDELKRTETRRKEGY